MVTDLGPRAFGQGYFRMYVLLLIFGTAIVAAGIALVGSGVSIQDHTFDPTVITPGAVAVVGGLILVGLALVLQQLRNIEKAIASRPVKSEIAVGVLAAELPPDPAIPVPSKVVIEPVAEAGPLPVVPAFATPAAQEGERLREKFPSLVRLDSAPVVAASDVSILPKPLVRADEEIDETKNVAAVRQASGAGAAPSGPRFDVSVRPNGHSDRVKNFDSFWPKRKRPGQAAPAVALQTTMPAPTNDPELPVTPLPSAEPEAAVTAIAGAPTPVSILKSGVVDGMAYTLYSDGSIEAQLPQGTLRFGSIAELRNHIEQSA
jgi:hypothetical protein